MSNSTTAVTLLSTIPDLANSMQQSLSLQKDSNKNHTHAIQLKVINDEAFLKHKDNASNIATNLSPESKKILSETEILISEPSILAALLQHDPNLLSNLKWCQSTFAGVDPVFSINYDNGYPKWTFTRFAGTFGPLIAEWCIGRIIEYERHFTVTAAAQKKKLWGGGKCNNIVNNYRCLSSLTLSILGCGDIGTHIAKVASSAFGMKTIGLGRTEKRISCGHFDDYTTVLKVAIASADYIISVLPSTPDTKLLLSHDVLSHGSAKKGGKKPVFINVGRGNVIDEMSILRALDDEYISAAILDVFEIEPLPDSSLLWEHPNVIVSPHVSGLTQAKDVPELFFENYRRYVEGEPIYSKLQSH